MRTILVFFGCLAIGLATMAANARAAGKPAKPVAAERKASEPQIAVFAGGCFWGVEAVFEHTKGVLRAESGYAGGTATDADYDAVSSGSTGHAEAVRIVYDPSKIDYERLLAIFFTVAHDPTQRDRQGPDIGPQYRSEIFALDAEQARIAQAQIARLNAAKRFAAPIVTRVGTMRAFYPAEDYHQDYARKHPTQPYIVRHDAPKVAALRARFPEWYRAW